MFNVISEQACLYYHQIQMIRNLERVQTILGITQLASGIFATYHLIRNDYFSNQVTFSPPLPAWQSRALRIITLGGNISLILNALISQPVIPVWKWTAQKLFTSTQIKHFFGSSSLLSSQRIIFLITLSSWILGFPSSIRTAYKCYIWVKAHRRPSPYQTFSLHIGSINSLRPSLATCGLLNRINRE